MSRKTDLTIHGYKARKAYLSRLPVVISAGSSIRSMAAMLIIHVHEYQNPPQLLRSFRKPII